MPNVAQLLKAEITRISRKEVRQHFEPLRKQAAALRHDIAALKRDRDALKREITQLAKGAARVAKAAPEAEPETASKARFSAAGVKALRTRLGLSAAEFGTVVGVSGQSIYLWEHERSRPRPAQIARLASLRGVGKKEAAKLLEAAQGEPKAKKRKK